MARSCSACAPRRLTPLQIRDCGRCNKIEQCFEVARGRLSKLEENLDRVTAGIGMRLGGVRDEGGENDESDENPEELIRNRGFNHLKDALVSEVG